MMLGAFCTLWALLVWFSVTMQDPALALRCLQCNSLITPHCTRGNLLPRECPHESPPANFCITIVATLTKIGLQATFRDCAAVPTSPECVEKLIESRRFRMCYHMCPDDGCNREPFSDYQHRSRARRDLDHVTFYIVLLAAVSTSVYLLRPIV